MPAPLARAIHGARLAPGAGNLVSSLRGRLILVTAVLIATAALMAVGLLEDAAQRHRASTGEQLGATARALSLAVDGRVLQSQAVMQTLAASPALANGDLASFEAQARGSLSDKDSWVVLFDSRGNPVVDTSAPAGAPPRPIRFSGFGAQWDALKRSRETVSDLVMDQYQHRYILHLDRLVMIKGKPTYDLSMVVRPDVLQRLIAHQDLPAGWYCVVLDSKGVLIARNIDAARWIGAPATESMLRRLQTASSGVFESMSRDGVRTLAAYNRSAATGWTVDVAIPRYEATGDIGHSLQWLSILGAVLLGLGGALTLWFLGSLARAIRSLESFAESLGRGQAVPAAQTGLSETDFIARSLETAAERLRARELELERINETLEVRVEEATARLVQSQKLEAIGQLTGGVAHDFNNLLTAVIGNLDLLRRKLTDERLLQFVENARSAADRGAKLTAQLLAFARKQRLKREPIDVNALIDGMGELLASTVDHKTRIETRLDHGVPPAMADRTQLEMVLLNLVINARDAMPEGGVVRIETSHEYVADGPTRPEHPPMGEFTRIAVVDDGVGMSPEVMERVLEPFFTTKAPGRGSGLGLPQALGVAQQLGGGLRIESGLGHGTQVQIYLPAAAPQDTN